jgi:hypothetical protein
MNSRHRKTLEAIFRDPVSPTIVWNDVDIPARIQNKTARYFETLDGPTMDEIVGRVISAIDPAAE